MGRSTGCRGAGDYLPSESSRWRLRRGCLLIQSCRGLVDSLACGALLAIAGPVIVTKKLTVLAGASALAILGWPPFFPTLMDHQFCAAALCYRCLRGSTRLQRHAWTYFIPAVAAVYRSNLVAKARGACCSIDRRNKKPRPHCANISSTEGSLEIIFQASRRIFRLVWRRSLASCGLPAGL
jgi:hypothetical protein